MRHPPRISEAEWQVMKVLWARSPLAAGEVVAALVPATRWSDKTIRTLLTRLVRKKAVSCDKTGRAYLYRPLLDQEHCVRTESRSFLRRITGGALMPGLAAFLDEVKLSPDQIVDLKRILDEKKGG